MILFSIFLLIFPFLNCYELELDTPPSRLLFVSYSHVPHIDKLICIARALPIKHQVTFALFDEHAQLVRNKLEPYRSLTIASLGPLLKVERKYEVGYKESNQQFMGRIDIPDMLDDYRRMRHPLLAHLQNHSYDMMILDFLAFAAQDIAHDLGVPFVIHSIAYISETPIIPAWIPQSIEFIQQQSLRDSFFLRFYNQVVVPLRTIYYLRSCSNALSTLRRESNHVMTKNQRSFFTTHWNDHPVLISNTIALEFRYNYKPNRIFLGFILSEQEKRHPKSEEQLRTVETWLNKTQLPNEFVLLVALGTLTTLRIETWQAIIDTLQLVPNMRLLLTIPQQTIRDKFHDLSSPLVDYSSRLLILPRIEQQHVLAHPSVRLFIGHGGLNSVGEAIYNHVPMIILPGFGDQPTVAAKVMEAKIGYAIERDLVTAEKLASFIQMILTDYDIFVSRLRRIHQISEVEGGVRRAAQLIDSWLLTGYTHLTTIEHELPFIVASSLDVRLTLITIIILFCYLIFRLVKCIVRSCLYRRKFKQS